MELARILNQTDIFVLCMGRGFFFNFKEHLYHILIKVLRFSYLNDVLHLSVTSSGCHQLVFESRNHSHEMPAIMGKFFINLIL